MFHLQEIRWDRPRFLSKSFLGFVAFNIISYSLLIAELVLIWFGQEHLHFYKHIFNGSYAVLMFIGKYYFPSVCTLEFGIDVGQRINIIPRLWGFSLLDLIIPELKSHLIPYKFTCSHWWTIPLKKKTLYKICSPV